ncbi:hypothetical protein J2T13_003113 [Paenibacillus sp. DS2015]|uniref:HTH domain-containing protein n=1 Tax=Paenibacillus sp. DS2015 TaxID=3373917 RepID=UPI003D19044B
MSKKLFNKVERENLSKRKYVTKISGKSITFAYEFKRLFIDQNMTGKTPKRSLRIMDSMSTLSG